MEQFKKQEVHSTHTEIIFLDGIVLGKWVSEHTPARAKKALTGYIRTAHSRGWAADINVRHCVAHAQALLNKLKIKGVDYENKPST